MRFLQCQYLWVAIKERLGLVPDGLELPEDNLRDIMIIEEAKKEWQVALRYFEEVTEPALIDFAIYNMEAAEKRLVHLIKMLGDKYPNGIWSADFWLALDGEYSNENEQALLREE